MRRRLSIFEHCPGRGRNSEFRKGRGVVVGMVWYGIYSFSFLIFFHYLLLFIDIIKLYLLFLFIHIHFYFLAF